MKLLHTEAFARIRAKLRPHPPTSSSLPEALARSICPSEVCFSRAALFNGGAGLNKTHYEPNTHCVWNLIAPEGKRIKLWFSRFSVDGSDWSSEFRLLDDFLQLREQATASEPLAEPFPLRNGSLIYYRQIPMIRDGTPMARGTNLTGDPETTAPKCGQPGAQPCKRDRRIDYRCPRPFIDTFISRTNRVTVYFKSDWMGEAGGFDLHYQVV